MGILDIIKGFVSAHKGFRWSLYFVHQRDGLKYALHENAVFVLLGYVAAQIERGGRISSDWQVFANFNHGKKHILLREKDFPSGEVSDDLVARIESLDKDFMVPGGKPVFVDVVSKAVLPLGGSYEAVFQGREERLQSIEAMLRGNSADDRVSLSKVLKRSEERRVGKECRL